MSADVLPGMPKPSAAFEAPTRSAGQRMTERQAQDVREGRHPLTGGPLHESADQAARPGDFIGLSYRCGSCVHRLVSPHRSGTYPKCDISTITHGQATDCRGWWPACPRWEAAS